MLKCVHWLLKMYDHIFFFLIIKNTFCISSQTIKTKGCFTVIVDFTILCACSFACTVIQVSFDCCHVCVWLTSVQCVTAHNAVQSFQQQVAAIWNTATNSPTKRRLITLSFSLTETKMATTILDCTLFLQWMCRLWMDLKRETKIYRLSKTSVKLLSFTDCQGHTNGWPFPTFRLSRPH